MPPNEWGRVNTVRTDDLPKRGTSPYGKDDNDRASEL